MRSLILGLVSALALSACGSDVVAERPSDESDYDAHEQLLDGCSLPRCGDWHSRGSADDSACGAFSSGSSPTTPRG